MWLVELTKVKFPWVAPLSLFCGKSVTYARRKETNRRFTSGVLNLLICFPCSDFIILPGFIDFTADEVVSVSVLKLTYLKKIRIMMQKQLVQAHPIPDLSALTH